jgi:hypothetical protein
MTPDRPLTLRQGHFLALFLGALPAMYVGFYCGTVASDIGSSQNPDLISILIRALICAVPLGVLGFLSPRVWLIPSLIYVYAFYCGYTFFDGLGSAVAAIAVTPFAALTGLLVGTPSRPAHPEVLWFLAIALWLAAFVSFLRRHHLRSEEAPDKPQQATAAAPGS